MRLMETSRVLEYMDHDHDHDVRGRVGHVFVGSCGGPPIQFSKVTIFIFILQQRTDITRVTRRTK